MTDTPDPSFERAAADGQHAGFLSELWQFLRTSRKWWLVPIIVMMVLLSALIFLSGTAVAPFIYTLF